MSRPLRIAAAAAIVLVAAIVAFAVFRPVQVLPRVGPAPPLELVDETGRVFRAPGSESEITIYTFGASRDLQGLDELGRFYREVGRALADAGREEAVAFRFITIDPDHDTPDALAGAAARIRGERMFALPEISFLTGSWVAVRTAVGAGFGVFFEAAAGAEAVETDASRPPRYDPAVIVVDSDHVIRSRYRLGEVQAATILRDVELIGREAEATGAGRLIYEGAHLFLCYPR